MWIKPNRVMPRRVIALAGMALATAACDPAGPVAGPTGATVGTEPAVATTATATATTVPSYDVPEVIDLAYVQRVASAFDRVRGDAIRVLVRDQRPSKEFLDRLLGMYADAAFQFRLQVWAESLVQGDLDDRPANPGDPVTTVISLVEASETCVIARADRDLRPTLTVDPEETPQDDYIVLVRKKPGRDPRSVNPTPWVMSFDGFKIDNSVPRNSCDD
ncbi:MAG: hypothetical protein ACRD0M_06795 [Acidimicrobiales bacterium]